MVECVAYKGESDGRVCDIHSSCYSIGQKTERDARPRSTRVCSRLFDVFITDTRVWLSYTMGFSMLLSSYKFIKPKTF